MVYSIAIDGPAGSGKSTVAKLLREKLGYITINSGNIYRSIGYVLNTTFSNYDINSTEIAEFVQNIELGMIGDAIYYKNNDITPFLRSASVDNIVAEIAKVLYIRIKVNELQHLFISKSKTGIIIEGRDIGTNVLPNAILKVYLDASPEQRAKRRYHERPDLSYDDTFASLKKRDEEDVNRKHGPLVIAHDAVVVDTTDITIDKVVDTIYALFMTRINI